MADDVGWLIAREQIRACVGRVARAEDRRDGALLRGCYWPEARLDFGIFRGDFEPCQIDGDTAHAETYYMFVGRNRDDSNWLAGGRYLDRLERRDGVFRIALRTNIIEWSGMLPSTPIPFADVPDIHENGAPARSSADPSYQRPLLNRRRPQQG